MKNDLDEMNRVLEEATAAGNVPADQLDPEIASLREAWLAFGEMLEAAQPPVLVSPLFAGERPAPNSPLFVGGGPGVMATLGPLRWRRLLATGLLAASLLIGIAMVWMFHSANRQVNPAPTTEQTASTHRKVAPSPKTRAKNALTAGEPQWDDSLDEQLALVDWQMLCVRENETLRTDAFGQAQYRMEQFRQTIEADSP